MESKATEWQVWEDIKEYDYVVFKIYIATKRAVSENVANATILNIFSTVN